MASKPVSYEGLAPIASAVVYIDLPNRRYMLTSVVALTSRSHLTLVPVERGKQLVSDAMLCNVGVGNAIASRFGTFDGGTCSAKVPVQATPERVANLLSRHRLLLIDLGPPVARVDVIVQGPRADEIAELSMGDKAMRVVQAMTELPVEDWRDAFGDAGVEALKSLREPQTLATLAFVFAIWAFAQTNPSGWAMDAALIGIAVVSLGLQVFGWIRQLEDCLTAIAKIRTPEDERQAAKALLKVLGRLGIDIVITLLTRAAGKAAKGATKNYLADRAVVAERRAMAPAKRNSGTTVLGHNPHYQAKANVRGDRYFDIPDKEWQRLTKGMNKADIFDKYNKPFIDRTIARGDRITLSNPVTKVTKGSYFEMELRYLYSKGYKPAADGFSLIPPP